MQQHLDALYPSLVIFKLYKKIKKFQLLKYNFFKIPKTTIICLKMMGLCFGRSWQQNFLLQFPSMNDALSLFTYQHVFRSANRIFISSLFHPTSFSVVLSFIFNFLKTPVLFKYAKGLHCCQLELSFMCLLFLVIL